MVGQTAMWDCGIVCYGLWPVQHRSQQKYVTSTVACCRSKCTSAYVQSCKMFIYINLKIFFLSIISEPLKHERIFRTFWDKGW